MIEQLISITRKIAQEELLPRYTQVSREFKQDGSVITEADLQMQTRLEQALKEQWPEYLLLGEEMTEAEQQDLLCSDAPGLWIVDPLDGTSNFASGVPFFSASIALMKNQQIEVGLVYDPLRDEMFYAEKSKGAFLDGRPLKAEKTGLKLKQTLALVDFKRLEPKLATNLATKIPYGSQRSFGSVCLDWCWIAAGRGHVYLHGKQKMWDYAAGMLILHEAGGHSMNLQGEAVFNGTLPPRSAVAALDEDIYYEWCNWIKENL